MTDPKDPAGTKVPRIVEDMGQAVARDIKPALRLMGRIFVNTWLGDQSFVVDVAKDVAKGARKKNATAGAPTKEPAPSRAHAHQEPPPPSNAGPEIIEAEIIEDKSCFTCGGTGKLGRPGYQVPCPKCR